VKTDLEWRKTLEDKGFRLRDENGGDACRELDEFIRAVQAEARRDAFAEARKACVDISDRAEEDLDDAKDNDEFAEAAEAEARAAAAGTCAFEIAGLMGKDDESSETDDDV